MASAPAVSMPTGQQIDDMDQLLLKTKQLGAKEGAKRLEFIRSQGKQLTPQTAYLWLDPTDVEEEIEQAQLNRFWIQVVHFVRNVFSLAPLIVTWWALFIAVTSYQQDLKFHSGDNTIPFLQLWQGGFNGITGFTFAKAAGLDVALLLCYLGSILLLHEMERRAHTRAVNFLSSETWRQPISKLMGEIEANSRKDVSHIENVVDAVSAIVVNAMEAVKQSIERSTDANRQAIESVQRSIGDIVTASERAIGTVVTHSEQAVNQTLALSTQFIGEANTKVETLFHTQVSPLIQGFQKDLTSLTGELSKYQGRLDDVTKASETLAEVGKRLAAASQTLIEGASTYENIGRQMTAQLTALRQTQNEFVDQIGTVANGISSAAASVNNASTNMVAATGSVRNLAPQLDYSLQNAARRMTNDVEQASQSLVNVTRSLQGISHQLNEASNRLASISFFSFFRKRSSK